MHGRCLPPHAAAKTLGFGLGAFELGEPDKRHARRDARQTRADKLRVHKHAVFPHDVGQVALVRVDPSSVGRVEFEPHPPVPRQRDELVARLMRKRPGCVVPASELRRVDAEQPDPPDRGHVDRVTIDDRTDQHGIGSLR